MGFFKLLKVTNLKELTKETEISESDYSFVENESLYQFEYIEENRKVRQDYEVKPGVFTIVKTMSGFQLDTTSFANDSILENFVNTQKIEAVVDSFFSNIHLYKEFGMEVAKRGCMLWGPPGCGKTTAISKCIRKYIADGKTAVIVWSSYKYEAFEVKDFIQTFNYVGVDKVILVVEDLGGIENEQTRLRADSSLLSLLDNQELTFKIPVFIIATTNYPENLAASIMNRPGRFDDKINIEFPPAEARVELLKFFAKEYATEQCLEYIKNDKCKSFTPAEIKEAYIRARLRNEPLYDTLVAVSKEKVDFEKAYTKSGKLGL